MMVHWLAWILLVGIGQAEPCQIDGDIITCASNGNTYTGEFRDNQKHGEMDNSKWRCL